MFIAKANLIVWSSEGAKCIFAELADNVALLRSFDLKRAHNTINISPQRGEESSYRNRQSAIGNRQLAIGNVTRSDGCAATRAQMSSRV
jgi:hypothetical protein